MAGRAGRSSSSHMARTSPGFMGIVANSPAAEIAARLMGVPDVRYFYDQLFIKEPGTTAPTDWHHDLPFWPFDGNDIASVWIALTPVNRDNSGLVYVAGSHKWDTLYRPDPAPPRENFLKGGSGDLPTLSGFSQGIRQPGIPVCQLGYGARRLPGSSSADRAWCRAERVAGTASCRPFDPLFWRRCKMGGTAYVVHGARNRTRGGARTRCISRQ